MRLSFLKKKHTHNLINCFVLLMTMICDNNKVGLFLTNNLCGRRNVRARVWSDEKNNGSITWGCLSWTRNTERSSILGSVLPNSLQ